MDEHESDLLTTIYALSEDGDIDAAVDIVLVRVDEMLRYEDFGDVDSLLSHVDVGRLDIKLLFSLIYATTDARDELPQRALLLRRVESRLRTDDKDVADRFLLLFACETRGGN